MYIDDIQLFAKNEKELETLIQAVRIYSDDIGMEFRKWALPILRSGKLQMTEEIELPNKEKIRTPRQKETYRNLGILEADTKQAEMKEKN